MTSDALLEHGLPADTTVERLILGVALVDPETQPVIFEVLESAHFALESHQRIYGAMTALRAAGQAIDRVTVIHELTERRQLESVGGIGYLVGLDDGLPKVYGLESYLRILQDKAILRQAATKAHQLLTACCQPGADIHAVQAAGQFYQALSAETAQSDLASIQQCVEEAGGIDALLAPRDDARAVPLPWPSLRKTVLAFRPGELIILAARPGLGKSAAACQIAVTAAQRGIRTAVFSLEMDKREILRRMVAATGGVNLRELHRGHLNLVDRTAAQGALTDLAEAPLAIDDAGKSTVAGVYGVLQREKALGRPIGFIVMDYLQLMRTPGKRDRRVEEISEISRSLKLLARDMRIPVLALSQLNREVVRSKEKPQLHHLRESGALEQDADVVLFLWRDEDEERRALQTGELCRMEVLIRKQRSGPVGKCELHFDARCVRLLDQTRESENTTNAS